MSTGGGGSVSHSDSKSKTRSSGASAINLSPASKAMQGINLDFAKQVLAQLMATGGFAGQLQGIPGLVGGFQSQLDNPTSATQDALLQKQLDIINGNGEATNAQRELIGQEANSAIASGSSDINNQLGLGLAQVRNELGPGLGLRPGDTPLIDRGNLMANEAQRQFGQLVTNVRGQQAQSMLNYPIQTAQAIGGLTQNASELQAQLRAQAFSNRLALTGQAGNLGLGLAQSYNPAQGFSAFTAADKHTFANTSATRGSSQGASGGGSASI